MFLTINLEFLMEEYSKTRMSMPEVLLNSSSTPPNNYTTALHITVQ